MKRELFSAEHACVVLVQLSSAPASDNTGMPAQELSVEAAWLTQPQPFSASSGYSNGGDALFRKIGTYLAPQVKQDVPPQGGS
ncbi:hypothetical protein [Nocardia salmonicida]|uniref:hypothetical protein n=1 Tax=Nocardia salmonicida TaxID=53431 RepID=UPI002E2B6A19|nr:hypothetical protein [Nocardia salmonicida]